MFGVLNYGTFALGALLIVLLPGPNSMYVLSVAARKGVRTGFRAATGVFLGDTTLIVLTSVGAASLLRATPVAFDVVKLIGAAYLVFIGYGMLKAARDMWRARHDDAPTAAMAAASTAEPAALTPDAPTSVVLAATTVPASAAPTTAAAAPTATETEDQERPFRRALVISLLNPKAILFLLSFFVQFVDRSYGQPEVSFIILGGTLQAFSFLYLTTLIVTGTTLANAFRRRRRLSAALTTGVAGLFIGFAAKLATASAG
ncbi:leucine efflux protein LeuE [Streptacidiphilus cavernicola]|uniref:Leucine efflux protein LeuE n=1 Tax=Streptacidiphilus cavernicola TaxID=3342716 RepID=A0ABV6VWP6_9ACTN